MSLRSCMAVVAAVAAACTGGEESTLSVGDGRDRDLPGDGGPEAGLGVEIGVASDAAAAGPAGATMDAAALGLDAALMLPEDAWILADGGILLPDGNVIDAQDALRDYPRAPDVSRCGVGEGDTWQAAVAFDSESGFALVPGALGFGLAFRALGTDGCGSNIDAAYLDSSGGLPELQPLLAECPAITDVALAAVSDDWHVAWVDNLTGSAELHTATLDAQLRPAGVARRRLTDNQNQFERSPVLRVIDGRVLLAWITRDAQSDEERITVQWLDGEAEPADVIGGQDGHQPQGLALSQVGPENAVLGWVGSQSNPGAWLVRLGRDGLPAGAPIQLTARAAASSSIDLAHYPGGGAAVYSIEIDGHPQIRFRRLDAVGMPIGEERIVVGAPLRGRDASLSAVAGGYAIAYRALPGGSLDEVQLRMTFVSKEGEVMRDPSGALRSIPLAPATQASARAQVAVSVDGLVMLAWLDAGSSSQHNALKLMRRPLDCE